MKTVNAAKSETISTYFEAYGFQSQLGNDETNSVIFKNTLLGINQLALAVQIKLF